MAGDIFYGLAELKRVIGNNLNKMANDVDVCADLAECEEDEIFFVNFAHCLRDTAEKSFFAQEPAKYSGDNIIDWDTEFYKRREAK